MKPGGLRASLRELARQGETSIATLKHYFGDRDGLLVAVMESLSIDGAPHMARASLPTSSEPKVALGQFLGQLCTAWLTHQVGQMQAAMLAEGLALKPLGPSYVSLMLEPLLQVGERVLQRLIDVGTLQPCDVRHAALVLQGPLVLALLHQDSLGGAACRPLELKPFVEAHVDAFLRAFPPVARPPAVSPRR